MPDTENDNNNKVTPETIIKLEGQITQLNQGIASERSARKTAEGNVAKLSKDLEEFKSKVEIAAVEETVDLSKEDEKKLEAWARQQGFVTTAELNAEKLRIQNANLATIQSEAVTEFLTTFPSLNDDTVWAKVQAAFQEYRTPGTKAATLKILNKIATDLGVMPKGKTSETDDIARAKARMINNGRLTLGGGQQSSGTDGTQTVEDLQRKYPNLSRDQIESRLSEIAQLPSQSKTGNKKK